MSGLRRLQLGALLTGAALAVCGTWLPPSAAEDRADAAEDARVERLVRRHIPGLTAEQRNERAAAAGELRVRGRTRLSGRVFATHVHIERDAEVETDGELVIYSTGGIVVDAPVGGGAAFRTKKLKPATGADGADGAAITMIDAAGDITINADVTGNPGSDGESLLAGAFVRGGDGGRGGAVTILAKKKGATITVNAVITPGKGGEGGDAQAIGETGELGSAGENAQAVGGRGGDGGTVKIQATNVVFTPAGIIALNRGADGGYAHASGGLGGTASSCFGTRTGNGGGGRAIGGRAGRGADVMINATSLSPADVGASAFVRRADSVASGGEARALGGTAGSLPACEVTEGCPAKGRSGTSAGSSGSAYARGGDGNSESRLFGTAFAGREPAAVEEIGGFGGNAVATAGLTKDGANGEDGQHPGAGGHGSDVGAAAAIGGRGGACRVATHITGVLNGGGKGGDATVEKFGASEKSGNGGAGGDCCNAAGVAGGAGGAAGKVGATLAIPGKGGPCRGGDTGLEGTKTLEAVPAGTAGRSGDACPVLPGVELFPGTSPGTPTHGQPTMVYTGVRNLNLTALSGLDIQFFHKNKGKTTLISKQTVDVDAARNVAGYKFVSATFTPSAAGPGQVLEIRSNGKVVASVSFDVN